MLIDCDHSLWPFSELEAGACPGARSRWIAVYLLAAPRAQDGRRAASTPANWVAHSTAPACINPLPQRLTQSMCSVESTLNVTRFQWARQISSVNSSDLDCPTIPVCAAALSSFNGRRESGRRGPVAAQVGRRCCDAPESRSPGRLLQNPSQATKVRRQPGEVEGSFQPRIRVCPSYVARAYFRQIPCCCCRGIRRRRLPLYRRRICEPAVQTEFGIFSMPH
jgi:hypothetical protein